MDIESELFTLITKHTHGWGKEPEYIYHYTSLAGLKGILDSAAFRFTNIRFLNDKSERKEMYEMCKKCCELLKSGGDENYNKFIDQIAGIDYDNKNDDFIFDEEKTYSTERLPADNFVLCFSKGSSSLPMWNYYSKDPQKKGYNLGFYNNIFYKMDLQKIQNNFNFYYGEVIYKDDEKMKYLKDLIERLYEIYMNSENREKYRNEIKNRQLREFCVNRNSIQTENSIKCV